MIALTYKVWSNEGCKSGTLRARIGHIFNPAPQPLLAAAACIGEL